MRRFDYKVDADVRLNANCDQCPNATGGKCDFIISFFDGLDFHRNAAQATLDPKMKKLREKYLCFLGAPDFFDRKEVVAAAKLGRNDDLSAMFKTVWIKRMDVDYQSKDYTLRISDV